MDATYNKLHSYYVLTPTTRLESQFLDKYVKETPPLPIVQMYWSSRRLYWESYSAGAYASGVCIIEAQQYYDLCRYWQETAKKNRLHRR